MAKSKKHATLDPIDLTADLIRRPSVTPEDNGALDVLQDALETLGFQCHRLPFEETGAPRVDNLYARLGGSAPNFCFAGHTDVVPVGDPDGWTVDPFGAEIAGDVILGRGATDMKGAIAAFVAAVDSFVRATGASFGGSISLLITGDEEGPAVNGTVKMLKWLDDNGEKLDHCLVGEPTNPQRLGDMIKIGRRGSFNGTLTVRGAQGHVAYPHLADNPLPRLIRMLDAITSEALDDGTDHFQPSNLEVTSIDTGNPATNVIPAEASARLNIRFNDLHTEQILDAWLRQKFDAVGGAYDFDGRASGDAFVTAPGEFTKIVAETVNQETGRTPELSTSGGTSDARFIKDHCPVAEFGLVGLTMHKADEQANISDIRTLSKIYEKILERYFADA
jgi:succinyl-diaminopimelate desuccinylase